MIEINRNPSARELRIFVMLVVPAFFAVAGSLAYWKFHAPRVGVAVWLVGAVLMLVGLAVPNMRRPLYVGWMIAVYPIGWTVSHVILLIVFYLVITPIGLVVRLFGRDPMERRLDRKASTYWIARNTERKPSSYFRQY